MQMDKETQIKSLKENKEALEGKVKFLQDTCRRAGAQIKKLEAEYKSLYKDKWEYYQGNLPDEDLKERGWDPFQLKVLKSDLSTYIDSDKDIHKIINFMRAKYLNKNKLSITRISHYTSIGGINLIKKTLTRNNSKFYLDVFRELYLNQKISKNLILPGVISILEFLKKKNIKILNNINVKSFVDNNNSVEVFTENFSYKTSKLFIATNGFSNMILDEDVKPARAQVLITKPIDNLKIKGKNIYQTLRWKYRS